MKHTKDLNSARMKEALYIIPKETAKIRNPPLPAIENESDKVQREGVNFLNPSNIIDICTRLEILLGLKSSGQRDSLREASNLIDELYERGEIQNEEQYRNALNKFSAYQMELFSKLLEQIVFNTRGKIQKHKLIIMDKSTHEEHLSQPLQTNNKQFKLAVSFLRAYNGIFNVTNSKNSFYFKKALIDEGFIQITIRPGASEFESSDDETKRNIIDENHYTEAKFLFRIKPNFSTLGSSVEILPQGPIIGFVFDDNIGNF